MKSLHTCQSVTYIKCLSLSKLADGTLMPRVYCSGLACQVCQGVEGLGMRLLLTQYTQDAGLNITVASCEDDGHCRCRMDAEQ